jgi:hypothetical protein
MSMRGFTRTAVLVAMAVAAIVGTVIWILFSSAPPGASPGAAGGDAGSSATAPRPSAPEHGASRAIKPRAFSESGPAEEGPDESRPSKGVLEVEVITPEGTPAANARVILLQGEKFLAAKRTREDGVAPLPAGEGEGEAVVLPEGFAAHRTRIALDAGRRRIELPPGVAITGRIEVAGDQAGEPVKISATCLGLPSVPEAAWDALDWDVHPACKVSSSGNFELRGLTPGSEWTFTPQSAGYRLDEVFSGDRAVAAVTAPAINVVIKLTRLTLIRGRVVAGAQRAPVPKAVCMMNVSWSTGAVTQTTLAGEDGRFVLSIGSPHDRGMRILRAEVTVMGPNRVGTKKVTLDPVPNKDVDLGDLEVAEPRTLDYVARDPEGKPIEGAFARLDYVVDPSTKTDAQGRGKVKVAAGVTKLFFGALRYAVSEVEIPPTPPDPLLVVLEHASGLEVRIFAAEGAVHPTVRVRISSEVEQLFPGAGNPTGNDPIHMHAGGSSNEMGTWGPEGSEFTFSPGPEGRYVVAGLRTGVPLKVDAIDGTHQALAGATVTLAPGEWKPIELKISKTPRSLRGRVRDPAGKPIAGAMAMIDRDPESVSARAARGIDSHQLSAATDAEGRFVLSGIFENVVHFGVDKEGYAPLVQRSLALPAEGTELDLRMQPGCRVTVKVRQPGGAPAADLELSIAIPGYPLSLATQMEPGTYVFVDLPADARATVAFWVFGQERTYPVVVKEGHVETITLPGTGTVVADFSEIGDGPYVLTLRASGEHQDRYVFPIVPPGPGVPRVFESDQVAAGEYVASLRAPGEGGAEAAVSQAVSIKQGEALRVVFKKP